MREIIKYYERSNREKVIICLEGTVGGSSSSRTREGASDYYNCDLGERTFKWEFFTFCYLMKIISDSKNVSD